LKLADSRRKKKKKKRKNWASWKRSHAHYRSLKELLRDKIEI